MDKNSLYASSFEGDCSGSLAVGDTKICTFTNTYIPPPVLTATGTLIIYKDVDNDDGGKLKPEDFSLNIKVTDEDDKVWTTSVSGTKKGISVMVPEGIYEVTEPNTPGYVGDFSDCVFGKIAAGDTKECHVINKDVPEGSATTSTLHVVKRIVNSGAYASQFMLKATYHDATGTVTSSTFPGSENGYDVVMGIGSYDVTELDVPANYTPTFDGCSGTMAAGATSTCTVTNTYTDPGNGGGDPPGPTATGTLIVYVTSINDDGGWKQPQDFGVNVAGVSPTPSTFWGSADGTSVVLGAGSYVVTEPLSASYAVTLDGGCTGSIAAGQTLTCRISNNDMQSNGSGGGTPSTGGGGGNGGGGQVSPATSAPTTPAPRVLGEEDINDAVGTCTVTEAEALFITSDVNDILKHLSRIRDVAMESTFNLTLTPRVVPSGLSDAVLSAVRNFINYGTASNVRLGQGERAGAVDSFRAVHGRVPVTDCDWQNVIKIAKTRLPKDTSAPRESQMPGSFKKVYNREANPADTKDDVALKVMAYGIRPFTRDLDAERAAIAVFKRIYGHTPKDATEWDLNRAIAYSGIQHTGLSLNLTARGSRITAIAR
ncbi:MAG: hypothetical protein V1745_02595 [Patescibacteria group bacterium]